MTKLILATSWKVKEEGNQRFIQLYDKDGNKVDGDKARWEGYFYCSYNKLTSLKGAPREVNGSFYCSDNELTSLEGAPREVNGSFYCSDNELTSLEGAPREVDGHFYCSYNKLTNSNIKLVGSLEEIQRKIRLEKIKETVLFGVVNK